MAKLSLNPALMRSRLPSTTPLGGEGSVAVLASQSAVQLASQAGITLTTKAT